MKKNIVMRKFIPYIVALTLVSCGAAKNIPTPSPSVRDSVRVIVNTETVYIKDTIKVPVPSQEVTNNTKESSSHLETDFAESDASIDSTGTLHHTLRNKAGSVPVPTETPVHHKDSIVYRDREVEVPVPYPVEVQVPRELTWWQETQMIGFWVMLLLLALKYRREIFGFIRRFI